MCDERYEKWHQELHRLTEKLLDERHSAQEKVDEQLNDVRHRFVPRELYESMQQKVNAALVGVILLLIGVVVDIASR